jgi:hypothetical protein
VTTLKKAKEKRKAEKEKSKKMYRKKFKERKRDRGRRRKIKWKLYESRRARSCTQKMKRGKDTGEESNRRRR